MFWFLPWGPPHKILFLRACLQFLGEGGGGEGRGGGIHGERELPKC